MGALLHLDARLKTGRAEQYLAPDGLWDRFSTSPISDPPAYRHCQQYIDDLIALCTSPG